MDAAVKYAVPTPRCYQRRRPEKTLWYHTVQTHLETWLALSTGQGDELFHFQLNKPIIMITYSDRGDIWEDWRVGMSF